MSDETNKTNNDEPISYIEGEFREGDFAGFKFNAIQFGSLEAAVGHYSPELVLAMVNTAIAGRIRSKVKNDLPKNLKGEDLKQYQAKLLSQHSNGVLFSQEQAFNYKPDQREIESPTRLFKEANKALQEAKNREEAARAIAMLTKAAQAAAAKFGHSLDEV